MRSRALIALLIVLSLNGCSTVGNWVCHQSWWNHGTNDCD